MSLGDICIPLNKPSPVVPPLPTVSTLVGVQQAGGFILKPDMGDPNASMQYVFLDPGVARVNVIPADYSANKEQASFSKFRNQYGTYWMLVNSMLLIHTLWQQ